MKNWKNFERDIAKIFGEAFGDQFYRTPGSGGFVGGKNQHRLELMTEGQKNIFSGDIIPPEYLMGLAVECKTRASFNFNTLFKGENKELNSWIDQTYHNECKLGLLIFKYQRSPTFILYEASVNFDKSLPHFTYFYNNTKYIITTFTLEWLKDNKRVIDTIFNISYNDI